MAPANRAGPAAPDLSPPRPAGPDDIRRRLAAGEWVVDLRARVAFAASHVTGTFSFPLEETFATYLGWLIPWGTPLTLLGESAGQVAQAQRELVRIGIDRPAAAATGGPGDWASPGGLASLRLVTFGDLAAALAAPAGKMVVLDVRRRLERAENHIPGSVHIPLHELPDRLDEVPPGEVWVHCKAGYRSTVAASMLAAHGRDVVSVDDDFANAGPSGLPLTSP
jgi:rhodanese-related sulfurtransferase